MDMLSDAGQEPDDSMLIEMLEAPVLDFSSIFRLPTIMTKLQREMSEAVLQIFREALEDEIALRRQRASINSLLENSDAGDTAVVRAKLVHLIFEQLKTITMHPALVVDHFIPKKILLLEIKERLLSMSGKLELFNRIVDLIAETYETPQQDSFNLLVVAESIKELEWVEGVVIGKKVKYHNLSTRKLFDDEVKFVKEESVDDENIEYRRKRRHLMSRMVPKSSSDFTLHLVTSRQLYLSPLNTQFDMVFSFDANLDVESPSIELMRSNNRAITLQFASKTPVIIPTPIYSIEHLVVALPKPLSPSEEVTWKLQVINAYAFNRHRLFGEDNGEFFVDNYGRNLSLIRQWLLHWSKVRLPNFLQQYTDELFLHWTDEKLQARLGEDFLAPLAQIFSDDAKWDNASQARIPSEDVTDYDTFKKHLANFLNDRTDQVETLVKQGLISIIPQFRIAETARQQEIDHDEDVVGEQYRKLRKLNEDANAVDRKFSRAEADHSKAEGLQEETQNMLNHLTEILKTKTHEELQYLINEQTLVLGLLEDEKVKLDGELAKITEESEVVRGEYQTKSTEAVTASGLLSAAKEKETELQAHLSGPGMQVLPSLARRDEKATFDVKLMKLNRENEFFLHLFSSRLDRLVRERTNILESTSTGSSSRPSNRISRASTPFT